MDERCLLVATHKNHEVCGDFLVRVGSVTIDELRLWLDRVERECEISKTQLLGMVIWTNEHLNNNIRRCAHSASREQEKT